MHDSSLPESADITPRHPGERPKLRPLIGVPEGALKENRRRGAVISVVSHLLIVILLLLPALFHREITEALTDGAGGPGAAGGGGGGSGGSPIIPERIQRYQMAPPPAVKQTPSVLPPITPVPPVVKPPVEVPMVDPTPVTPTPPAAAPAPVTVAATPAPGAGAGAGAGTDPGPGNGPGTGGGNGSGVGTGTGSAIGSGTGGGNATIYPAQPRALFVPPNGTPRRLRGKTITIELELDETGKVLAAEFSPRSGDNGYDEQFLNSLREQRFRPAVRANGQPIKFTYRYEITLGQA
jgi:TonB family protein